MSQDNPKKTGTPENNASERASRRRFLKGGAMAAVGALTTAVVPKAAEAGVFNPDGTPTAPVSYHPNETLAKVIANAWADDSVKAALIADPKTALAKEGLYFEDVKVLSEDDYHNTAYFRRRNQVIFVLPNKPPGLGNALDRARVAMQVTPFGM